MPQKPPQADLTQLASDIKRWGAEMGFAQVGITHTNLQQAEQRLDNWLNAQRHGDMAWMQHHGVKRSRPAELVPDTVSVISVRLDYLPKEEHNPAELLDDNKRAYVSRYALGRDYHKIIRNRLQKLANKIKDEVGVFGYRAFTDSAPVLEKPLAQNAGLGWIGKHTNLINKNAGSWFFLGELYTDLPLPTDAPATEHCGSCHACMDVCPTQAITGPFQLDARRCISYLTIEKEGAIPEEFRKAMGNRIYGCDDCQLFCPWNKFAQYSTEEDFTPRNNLDDATLIELFAWSEKEFLDRTQGSAIRRIGHERWLRNIAVALGNAKTAPDIITALKARQQHKSPVVREHVNWALAQHG